MTTNPVRIKTSDSPQGARTVCVNMEGTNRESEEVSFTTSDVYDLFVVSSSKAIYIYAGFHLVIADVASRAVKTLVVKEPIVRLLEDDGWLVIVADSYIALYDAVSLGLIDELHHDQPIISVMSNPDRREIVIQDLENQKLLIIVSEGKLKSREITS